MKTVLAFIGFFVLFTLIAFIAGLISYIIGGEDDE